MNKSMAAHPTITALGLMLAIAAASTSTAATNRSASTSTSRAPSRSAPVAGTTGARIGRVSGFAARGAAGSSGTRSLLANGPRPSPQVVHVIEERERSGPGWIGISFLVSMLSQHDLSPSDRNWVQGKIDSIKANGGDAADGPLPASKPKVMFSFAGIDVPLVLGQSAVMSVSAYTDKHVAMAPICTPPAAATISVQHSIADIHWTPATAGVFILTCQAGTHTERRLLRVISKGNV